MLQYSDVSCQPGVYLTRRLPPPPLPQVLWEMTKGELGRAPDAVGDSLPTAEPAAAAAAQESDGEEDLEEMQERLQALRS